MIHESYLINLASCQLQFAGRVEQRKPLVDLINELHSHMSRGQEKAVIGKTMDELIDYTANHFTTEETWFDLYGYT